MLITDYTSYREVRTVAGLTIHDISDAMLSDELFVNELYIALSSITLPDEDPGPGSLIDRFDEIKALEEAARTSKEQLLYSLTRIFASYVVADAVLRSASLLAGKILADGKTSFTRFSSEATFLSTKAEVKKMLGRYKRAIKNINGDDELIFSFFSVVTPATDIVTNE